MKNPAKLISVSFTHEGKTVSVLVPENVVKHYQTRYGPSRLSEVFRALADDDNSFSAVAKRYGVTREAMRLCYMNYLAAALPRKNGRERSRYRMIAGSGNARKLNEAGRRVREKALAHGLEVRYVLGGRGDRPGFVRANVLEVNGKVVRAAIYRNPRKAKPSAKISYYSVSWPSLPPNMDFFVVICEGAGTYVFPKNIGRSPRSFLHIPVLYPGYRRKARTDYEQFREAWNLLK